jgi:ribosomal-protein-alanine N-acetyltransferase
MCNDQVILRQTELSDLETLYLFQLDKEANFLAAFTSKESANRESYIKKYTPFLRNPTINMQTILLNGTIVGSLAKFEIEGEAEVTYWIDKKSWGTGVASKALKDFLITEKTRSIRGRVAFDNIGSRRVLEKCGFLKIGTDKGFANARQQEIEAIIYLLS